MYLTWPAHRLLSFRRVCCLPQAAEASSAQAPEITVEDLIDRARAMFTGGSRRSGPSASGMAAAASEASDGLLVDATAAVNTVMKPCTRKGRRLCGRECAVHLQCDPLDKEEMLGYLVADALGQPLLSTKYARSVGETARLRATKAAPAIQAAQRRCKAASADGVPQRRFT